MDEYEVKMGDCLILKNITNDKDFKIHFSPYINNGEAFMSFEFFAHYEKMLDFYIKSRKENKL